MINNFDISLDKTIIFEDSITGYQSIKDIEVSKVFIMDSEYYYYNDIKCNLITKNYLEIDNKLINYTKSEYISNKIDIYKENINQNSKSLDKIVNTLYPLVLGKTIYLLGIGKSAYIAKKCVSTWRSLGIKINTLKVEDLYHGEFGIFKENDIIIYLSNSGNTIELINVAKHLKNHFNTQQIVVSNNKNCELGKYCDYCFTLENKIKEIDNLGMAPTSSSIIFMMLFDLLGVKIAESKNLTKQQFKIYHPGGSLGKLKPLDYVVISALGKGTRLYPLTKHIPKLLINIGTNNILCNQLNYWRTYTDNIIILLGEEHNNIVKFYCNLYETINIEIINVPYINNCENAYTLSKGLYNRFNNNKVLITWCDILIGDNIDFSKFNSNIIFTYGNECRYKAGDNNKLYQSRDINNKSGKEGNVIGMFYINKMNNILIANHKQDLCDVFLKNFSEFNTYALSNLIDVGDMKKFDKYILKNINKFNTRSFNKITEISKNTLLKESLNQQGHKLIGNEKNFYKIIDTLSLTFPKIYKYNKYSFEMEYLKNIKPVSNFYINNELNANLLQNIFDSLEKLHNSKTLEISKKIFNRDIYIEVKDKIYNRLKKVNILLNNFDIKKVNNIRIDFDIDYILDDLYKKIKQKFQNTYNTKDDTKYVLIHGDCQFSNTLYDEENGKIYFIDPRGYFGKTKFYGIKEYDYAKVLYGLSNYDKFNNNQKYYFDIIDGNIKLNIKETDLQKYKQIFEKNNIDFDLCMYFCIINWIGLVQYNMNNIQKCIASYYNAIYMYHIYIKNFLD